MKLLNHRKSAIRVLHIIPSYYPAFKYGGPIESVYLLNKALIKKEILVDVLTTNAGLESREDILVNKWVDLDGVRVKYFPYYFYEHYNFSPQLFSAAFSEIKNYDLVHITAFWNFPVLAGSLASILNKKPYIISPRGVLYPEAINIKSKFVKKSYFYIVAKHYMDRASAVHFTTEDEKDNIASFVKINSPAFVVPNGVDISQYKQLPEKGLFREKYPVLKDKKYILFLGRINKKKGLDILVDAFKEIAAYRNDVFLVIAGPDENNYSNEIKTKLKNHGLLERVLFVGMLVGQDKLSAYRDADIFVLPSYSENFGMTVVEAMACGTPVVISNKVGIFKEIEKYNAGITTELNKENIYKSIKELLENEAMSKNISQNAHSLLIEKYDINIVVNEMISHYRRILEKNVRY